MRASFDHVLLGGLDRCLRRHLTQLLGASDSLQEEVYGVLNEAQKEKLSLISSRVAKMETLCRRSLHLAWLSHPALKLKREPVKLTELVRDCVEELRPEARLKGLDTELVLDSRSEVMADRKELSRLLRELLRNAIQYTSRGGDFGVFVRESRRQITLSVWDTGPGIAGADLSRVSTPFFSPKLSEELESCQGEGLGLALASAVASAHGWQFDISSVGGLGTRVSLKIPMSSVVAQ